VNPGLLDLLAQSAEAQRADPTQRPACPDERPHDCAAIDAEPRPLPLAQQPTVRPPRCGCGRGEIAGHACAGCDAPQWVAWPTHAGWWWVSRPMQMYVVRVDENLDLWAGTVLYERDGYHKFGWRFLDARLTPPAPPGDR
jgi:hypothetical protein